MEGQPEEHVLLSSRTAMAWSRGRALQWAGRQDQVLLGMKNLPSRAPALVSTMERGTREPTRLHALVLRCLLLCSARKAPRRVSLPAHETSLGCKSPVGLVILGVGGKKQPRMEQNLKKKWRRED